MFNQNKSSIAAGGPPSDDDSVLRMFDEAGLIRDSNDLTLKKTGWGASISFSDLHSAAGDFL